mmetsp:Transcript_21198/g.52098  ORF Transcript_21198/g.52098 Transcript_21198/m.52098 type:complete len:260 (-) Transcript_21198:2321-3100(-)
MLQALGVKSYRVELRLSFRTQILDISVRVLISGRPISREDGLDSIEKIVGQSVQAVRSCARACRQVAVACVLSPWAALRIHDGVVFLADVVLTCCDPLSPTPKPDGFISFLELVQVVKESACNLVSIQVRIAIEKHQLSRKEGTAANQKPPSSPIIGHGSHVHQVGNPPCRIQDGEETQPEHHSQDTQEDSWAVDKPHAFSNGLPDCPQDVISHRGRHVQVFAGPPLQFFLRLLESRLFLDRIAVLPFPLIQPSDRVLV